MQRLRRQLLPYWQAPATPWHSPVSSGAAMGKATPVPLLGLAALLGLLALKELATPIPTRAAPPPGPPGPDIELDDETDEDPFAGLDEEEEEGGAGGGAALDPDTSLSAWLPDLLGDDDADDAMFAFSGDGIDTVGDLIEAKLTDQDLQDMGLSAMNVRRLNKALKEGQRRKKRPAEAGQFGGGEADAAKPPVPPMKAAAAQAMKYVFYAGMVFMWFGERLFGLAGMPVPPWYHQLQANKTQVLVGLMILNHMGPMMLGV